MMSLTMEILRVTSFFLLFCCYSVFSFPSRPLNERSTELAWQAWLLVDDQQNQHKQSFSENFPRRRITPKSVFIAPTFSPESLPACADGYRPDSMGRCIKIIKLDEEAHLEFLLEKLNAQFGNYDEEEESQESEAGPFQLNIPIDGPLDGPKKGLDIAIVVAPTNGNFGFNELKTTTTPGTTNVLGNSNAEKTIPPHSEDNPSLVDETNNSKRKTEAASTTETHSEITNYSESTQATTLKSAVQELTETTSSTVTTIPSATEDATIIDQHALFFLHPPLYNSEHVQNSTWNVSDTPVFTTSDDDNKAPSNNSLTTLPNSTFVIDATIKLSNKLPLFSDRNPTESTTTSQADTNFTPTSLVRFPTDEPVTPTDYVKFPDQFSAIRILPQLRPAPKVPPVNTDSSKQPLYQTLFKGYLNPNGSNSLKGNEHFVFKDVTNIPGSLVSDPESGNQNTNANYNQVFNHRNRDKNSNLWSIPTSWSQSSPKPIVLRFSRSGRHLLSEQLQTQNSQTFYREVPSEEFSYIFGRDKNHNRKENPR